MPDTLTPQELATIREDMTEHPYTYESRRYARALLAHIDALTAAVEALDEPFQWLVDNYPKAMREMPTHVFRRYGEAAAILRGEWTDPKG